MATITSNQIIFNKIGRNTLISRFCILLILTTIPLIGGEGLRNIFFHTLSSAYISVTVFVALTLIIFYGLEYYLRLDINLLLEKYRKYQIPIAAVVGALPGCGGAIMVMTQYSIGRTGFGAVVAVLTSTMGDAAFLLIAQEPMTGFAIMAVSISVGTLSGYIVEHFHGFDFMRLNDRATINLKCPELFRFGKLIWPWIILFIPGIILGFSSAFQMDIDTLVGINGFEVIFGTCGAILSLFLWFINPLTGTGAINRTDVETPDYIWSKTITDTSFVTVWVIIAFLMFDVTVFLTNWDLTATFSATGPFVPLIGVLIGFLPGCGPQVLTTSLYLQGIIPLSAQLGNAISNDGDALFPAMAVSPKVSIVATLYTAIPALIVAYGYYFLREV